MQEIHRSRRSLRRLNSCVVSGYLFGFFKKVLIAAIESLPSECNDEYLPGKDRGLESTQRALEML
jgi:hypothetical protein